MRFYVNDYLFEICETTETSSINQTEIILGSSDSDQVLNYYDLVKSGKVKGKTGFVFVVNNYEKIVKEVKSNFKIIQAAGGVVIKDSNLLLIHRLGKWDLPKGKMEKGEMPEFTAVREVEEECGVKAKLENKIGETWHTYSHKGKEILKCTHWYQMICLEDEGIKPQVEEDIDQVVWVNSEEAQKLLLNDSYASIVDIYLQFKADK